MLEKVNVSKKRGFASNEPGHPLAVPQTLATALRPRRPAVATESVLTRVPVKGCAGPPPQVGKLKPNDATTADAPKSPSA